MFRLAEPSFWMDALRLPTEPAGADVQRRVATTGAADLGARTATAAIDAVVRRGSHLLEGPAADAPAGTWEPVAAVSDGNGNESAYVWRSDSGISLPFDPDEAVLALLSERYLAAVSIGKLSARAAARRRTIACDRCCHGKRSWWRGGCTATFSDGSASRRGRRDRSGGSLSALALVHGRRRRGARAVARSVANGRTSGRSC